MTDQVRLLRKLSGQKRLEAAISLSATVREVARANIKNSFPKANKTELQTLLKKRLVYG